MMIKISAGKQFDIDVAPVSLKDIKVPAFIDDHTIDAWREGVRSAKKAENKRDDLLRINLWQMRKMYIDERMDKDAALDEVKRLRAIVGPTPKRKFLLRRRKYEAET